MDKMTPICQKGYSSSRYCQEVLISVIEGIEKCNFAKRRACIISLDIKKAFDSLSHNFLDGVYDFFNFGPRLKRWISLLSTNRMACIMLGSGKLTNIFELERGNAQGDTISPFLFNLGYQILLFKLELFFQIEGTLSQESTVAAARVTTATGRAPRVSLDPKVSAMADDCTLLVNMTADNLQNIITCLNSFENISGLGCNLEKTALMPIGNLEQEPVPQDIIDLGLTLVNEIVLLGAKLKNTGLCFENNGTIILEKVRKQTNFWRRFNLSLPGRIAVTKSFVYSQINYLGCFMPINQQCCNDISREIERYVRGNLKIGTQKIYDGIENGGLGLFKLKDFLASQACAWIKRAAKLDEIWKLDLFCGSYNNVFNIRKENFNTQKNPILRYLAESYERFFFRFTTVNENFKKAWIFDNPCLTFDPNNRNYLKREFFTQEQLVGNLSEIYELKVSDFLDRNNVILTKELFEQNNLLRFSLVKYNVLCGLIRNALINYSKVDKNAKRVDTVKDFCCRIRSGSKKFRKILSDMPEVSISSNIHKYADILDQVINLETSVRLNSQWAGNFLSNSTRTFLFKLHNNLLGINTRVAHFVRGHSRDCTFCSLRQNPEEQPETIKHIFFDCIYVEQVLAEFYKWWLNDQTFVISRTEFFQGFNYTCINKVKVLDLTNIFVKQYIWDCKLRFSVPQPESLKRSIFDSYNLAFTSSRKIRDFTNKSNIFNGNNNIHF